MGTITGISVATEEFFDFLKAMSHAQDYYCIQERLPAGIKKIAATATTVNSSPVPDSSV